MHGLDRRVGGTLLDRDFSEGDRCEKAKSGDYDGAHECACSSLFPCVELCAAQLLPNMPTDSALTLIRDAPPMFH